MPSYLRLLAVALALLLASPAWAQEKGYLGVELQDITKDEAEKIGWSEPRGVRVIKPREGGPAATAGLLPNDIIYILDGQEVENMQSFVARIGDRGPGARVRLRLLRAGKERTLTVTLGQRSAQLTDAPVQQKGELPNLQLDPGGHMAIIRGVTFTPDGKHVVSAGEDKIIRVWDWEKRTTVRTIRGQVGPGPEGKVYCMALSPDGRWVAVGGYTGTFIGRGPREEEEAHKIRLYDFATGRVAALLKGHTGVVNGIAFSPDSKRIASGSGLGDFAAIIWDVESRRPIHVLKGHTAHIYAVAFSPDGERVVTGSYDKKLKLWSVRDGKEIATMTGHKDRVFRVAVSPVDGMIASSSDDGEIRLWNGKTGAFLRVLGNQGSEAGGLAFTRDGKRLVSTCGGGGCRDHPQIVWDVASGTRLLQPMHHDNIVLTVALSPDDRLVATGGGNNQEIKVWDLATGKAKHALVGSGASRWTAGFSPDGRRIGWGSTSYYVSHNARGPLEMQLRLPDANQGLGEPEPLSATAAETFVRANPKHGAFTLMHRKGGDYGNSALLDLKMEEQTLATMERSSTDGYEHRSYSFTPDGRMIISSASNGNLDAYDLRGRHVGAFIGHEGDVWAATASPDGRLLVSGSDDQTVRLWNLQTRELIATLFHGRDGNWVMWTPQGYYMGSPGADKYVGWQINRGPGNAADYVGAEQLRTHLNRPDIVQKAIILASAEQAMRESPGTNFKLADLLAKPVPRFRIVSPQTGSTERRGRTSIKIVVDAVPNPVKIIRVQVNGRLVDEMTPPMGSGGFQPGERILDVPLSKGRNDVRITLINDIGEKTEIVTLNHTGDGELDKRGTLYILAIGVDRYPELGTTCGPNGDQTCDLRFSGADARRLVKAAEDRLGPSHANVVKRVLVNGASGPNVPTASNIIDATDFLKKATEIDTVLVFIAGHGVNDGPNYRFLATNAERDGDTFRNVTVVPWQFLQEAIETAKGRRVLFIDTCHSGNAYNQKLGNTAFHANIIAYTSARFDQEAMEDAQLGHGLFTYAVVEGLEGKGSIAARREISTKDLAEYVVRRVDQLAKNLRGEQEPQYFKARDAEDYVLARW